MFEKKKTPKNLEIGTSNQASVVHNLDRAIHRINHYPANKYEETNWAIQWIKNYSVDIALSNFSTTGAWRFRKYVPNKTKKADYFCRDILYSISGVVILSWCSTSSNE